MRFFNRHTGERVGAAETAEGWQMRQRKIAKHLEAEEIVNGNKALGVDRSQRSARGLSPIRLSLMVPGAAGVSCSGGYLVANTLSLSIKYRALGQRGCCAALGTARSRCGTLGSITLTKEEDATLQATTRVARFLLPLALALLISVTVAAQDVETAQEHQEQAAPAAEILERMGFGLHVGTTGIGLDVAYRALPWLTARLNGGYIGFDFEVSGADASFQLWNIGAVADIYPSEDDGFHVSAGLGYFDLSLTAAAEDAAAEGAEASLNSGPVGGYLGLGFGNVAAAQGLIGVTFDLGVILTGAKVEAAEDSGIDELLSSVGIDPGKVKEGFLVAWPVLSLGVSFRPGR